MSFSNIISDLNHKKVKFLVYIVSVSLLLGCSGSVPTDGDKRLEEFVPGQVIVGFNNGISFGSAQVVIASYDLTWLGAISPNSGSALVGVPVGQEKHWVITLAQDPIVKYAELNFYVHALD